MNLFRFIKKKRHKFNDTILVSGLISYPPLGKTSGMIALPVFTGKSDSCGCSVIVGKSNKVSGFYDYRKEKNYGTKD